jgi:hypothetical protein
MNFFRLRFLNTLLFFVTGIILGFILKERFSPGVSTAAPPAAYPAKQEAGDAREEEALQDEPYLEEEEEPQAPAAGGPVVLDRREYEAAPKREPAARNPEIVIEPQRGKPDSATARPDDAADFFSHPDRYSGREVVLSLQMITAKKSPAGWRLNLVYSPPSKKIDYLYVEDTALLGESPDLRIGYGYKVRFTCGKGAAVSGNTLLAIEPTGEKADWATGLSAVE